jgi:hypothetical protein
MLLAAIGLAGVTALGGCAYDDGYYGGVSVGSGYYGGGYYDDYWGPGYYGPTYGWYNDYYYPGSGYYVYDRGGRRHRWNEGQQRYWEGRRGQAQQGEHWRARMKVGAPGKVSVGRANVKVSHGRVSLVRDGAAGTVLALPPVLL